MAEPARPPVAALREHRLLAYMLERERVRLRRAAGQPPPWTDDLILQRYRFTNIRREDDRVTVWLREHWREPYAAHPSLWFALALARQINWPPTLADIGFPEVWEPAAVLDIMRARAAVGEKVYTGAYMLRCDVQDVSGVPDKPYYTVYRVVDPLWRCAQQEDVWRENGPFRRLEDAATWFEQFHGWGGFLAYEVVTDLRHTRYLRDAPDINTWAHAGPGAVRGLNRLCGRPTRGALGRTQALDEMRWLLRWLSERWPREWAPLELRDVEHNLCEFDKYERVRLGEGKPRATFHPHTDSW